MGWVEKLLKSLLAEIIFDDKCRGKTSATNFVYYGFIGGHSQRLKIGLSIGGWFFYFSVWCDTHGKVINKTLV